MLASVVLPPDRRRRIISAIKIPHPSPDTHVLKRPSATLALQTGSEFQMNAAESDAKSFHD
jgi:hypothetical protein